MKRLWILLLILFTVLGFSGMADAKLIKIGTAVIKGGEGWSMLEGGPPGAGGPGTQGGAAKEYNLIYEDDQGLIWLDYTSPANLWPKQMEWAAGLNAPGVLTCKFDPGITVSWEGDWRLPKTVDGTRRYGYDGTTTAGFNITTSELGHLYYVSLGNVGYYEKDGTPRPGWGTQPAGQYPWGLKNKGPFTNLREGQYWSGTEYSADPIHAWDFNMSFGAQEGNIVFKEVHPYLGIAVRQGKVSGIGN